MLLLTLFFYKFTNLILMEDLFSKINAKLGKNLISSQRLLSRFRVIDERSRKSSAYNDPKYAPLYYYLGCELKPKAMAEIGFRLGLLSGCFLTGCKTVEKFFAFQEKNDEEFYSPRFGKHNIQNCYSGDFDIHHGKITDKDFECKFKRNKWDLVIINEEVSYDKHMLYLNFAWDYMNPEGVIIQEYVNYHKLGNQAFRDFCKIKNREPIVFNSKYGTGLLER